jgi:hypothetical protein
VTSVKGDACQGKRDNDQRHTDPFHSVSFVLSLRSYLTPYGLYILLQSSNEQLPIYRKVVVCQELRDQ